MKKILALLLTLYATSYGDSLSTMVDALAQNASSGNSSTAQDTSQASIMANNNKSSQAMPEQINLFFHGETLAAAMQSFARSNGWQALISHDLSPAIKNKLVRGRFSASSNSSFLDSLALQYGFNWFIYSGTLYITPLKQMTASANVAPENMVDIKNQLREVGLLNPKFGYSELPAQNKVLVSGPSEYVNLVIGQIQGLDVTPVNQQFAIFHLKYANANDTILSFNNQQIVIPGVATLLQGMLNSKKSANGKISNNLNQTTNNGAESVNVTQNGSDSVSQGGEASNSYPLIEADDRLNTIIIRDKQSNLQLYKNIIEQLDVPAPLIQIEVLIVSIDQDKLSQKGINWWASKSSSLTAGFGAANLNNGINNNLSFSYNQVNPGQLLVTNLNSFASNLQFLENNSIAQTMAKPSLATTDNLPAIITTTDNISTTGMQAQSNNSSPNSANNNYSGIQITRSLQITPHLITSKNGNQEIKLSIVLQDGSVNPFSNSNMPNYNQSYLNSQAVINEGQSIILAGYTKNSQVSVVNEIPGLGDIPGLGWLFKSSTTEVHRITTFYVVTPKIIWNNDQIHLGDKIQVESSDIDIKNNYNLKP